MSVLHDDQIPNAWMLLQVPDRERSHGGNSGYEDIYGAQYQYDSFVPNSNRLAKHDFVILRNKEHALGYGYIKEISSAPSMKLHRRCPECRSTKIRKEYLFCLSSRVTNARPSSIFRYSQKVRA